MCLSTLSLNWPSYTIRATIFEKCFDLKNSPKLNISLQKEYQGSIFYFLATLCCSLLEFSALIAIPCTSGFQAGH